MTEAQLTSFRMMLSMAKAEVLTPFEVQQLVTRAEIVLDHLTAERDRLRDAIEDHRRNVWGGDGCEVGHYEDEQLYAALQEKSVAPERQTNILDELVKEAQERGEYD